MITFERIREIERAERESRHLQKLPTGFASELKEYLAKKTEITSPGDEQEIKTVKSVIERLLEHRERKLIEMAITLARGGGKSEQMQESETEFVNGISERLKMFRNQFFDQIGKKAEYKVLQTIPEFIGTDLKTYKLKQGDLVSVPDDVAQLLIKRGVIERMG